MKRYLININSLFDEKRESIDYACDGYSVEHSVPNGPDHFVMHGVERKTDKAVVDKIGLVCVLKHNGGENLADHVLIEGEAIITIATNDGIPISSILVDHEAGKRAMDELTASLGAPSRTMERLQQHSDWLRKGQPDESDEEEDHRPG